MSVVEEVIAAISYKLLGTAEWFVIHHTDCGMEFFTNDVMAGLLDQNLETAELGDDGFRDVGDGRAEGHSIDWLTIADREQSAVDDVLRIREHQTYPRLRVRLRRPHGPPRRGSGRQHRGRAHVDPPVTRCGVGRCPQFAVFPWPVPLERVSRTS
jgi:hypothetical protein